MEQEKERKVTTYREVTLDEAVEMVLTSSRSAVQSAKSYYTSRGEADVVEKINKARKLASIRRIELKLKEQEQ